MRNIRLYRRYTKQLYGIRFTVPLLAISICISVHTSRYLFIACIEAYVIYNRI